MKNSVKCIKINKEYPSHFNTHHVQPKLSQGEKTHRESMRVLIQAGIKIKSPFNL